MNDVGHRRVRAFSVLGLALAAYLPALLSSPGRMPADTKLYLYFDTGRLMNTARHTWDPSQFGGWVPHQMISYLWPSGPWFWLCDRVGLPVWVAHRLWIGSLLVVGGWGVLRLGRALGLSAAGALAAACVYQFSPYILPYISRTSVMLLPWASLGWLVLLTMHSFRQGGWRHPALFALVIATAANVNATAFLMIVPGPVLWVALEWGARRLTTRRVLAASVRLVLLSAVVSLWWIVMLSIQGRFGADVLSFSERLDDVSLTSTGTEIVRSLGYWLFYIRDPYAAATTASAVYQTSPLLVLTGFALLVTSIAATWVTSWSARRFGIGLIVIGAFLAVGVHPFSNPAPALMAVRDSGIGLALRSSTRALPLLALGSGLLAGALCAAVAQRWRLAGVAAPALVIALALLNLPSLWHAKFVDPALSRDEHPPTAWTDAARVLDQGDPDSRVLQVPGSEFGAFRWGYTVDPPLPAVTTRPVITRDLLPLGSAGVMDLLDALDNRIQQGTVDTASIAPVARLLAADDIWISNDLAFDRFRTARPEPLADELSAPIDGLQPVQTFGDPQVNTPDLPMVDEQSLSDNRIGQPIPPVVIRAVADPVGMARVGSRVVVVDGSGDGLVDAAGAGLLTGDEAVLYANDLSAEQWRTLPPDTLLVVTDSNRDRDHQWRGSQDVTGMTESGGPTSDGVVRDAGDVRLAVFADQSADAQTIAQLADGVTAQASSYGDRFTFMPENRAAMAVDGDPTTAWRVGQTTTPVGESITVTRPADGILRLVQAQGRSLRQMIDSVSIASGSETRAVVLTDASLTEPGQAIEVPAGGDVTITIQSTRPREGAPPSGEWWVGFAELGPVADEVVRPPLVALAQRRGEQPLAVLFHRDRVRPTDRWRSDPEPSLQRTITMPQSLTAQLDVSLALSGRAPDEVLNGLRGWSSAPTSSDRLVGVPAAAATAAFDGDPATSWMSAFNTAIGTTLTVPVDPTASVTTFDFLQPGGDDLSTISGLSVTSGGTTVAADLQTTDVAGMIRATFPALTGPALTLTVTDITERRTIDRRYGDSVVLPVAIAEISGLPTVTSQATPPTCRDDLLSIDGTPVPLLVDTERLLSGQPVKATTCDGSPISVPAGSHSIRSAVGTSTGIDVNDVRLFSTEATEATAAAATAAQAPGSTPRVTVAERSNTSYTLSIEPCPTGCWLIFGQGLNTGWQATQNGRDLGDPTQVSGGFNGWWLAPFSAPATVAVSFAPQGTLTLALWLSLLGVLCCVAVVVRGLVLVRRGKRPSVIVESDPPQLIGLTTTGSRRSVAAAAAALLVATAVFVAPAWIPAAAVLGLAVLVTRRPRLIALGATLVVGGLGLVVARRVDLYRYAPGTSWPGHFEDLHRLCLFALLAVAVAAFATDARADRRPILEPHDASPTQNPDDDVTD